MGSYSLFFQIIYELADFFVGNEGALDAGGLGLVRRDIEHVSTAEKFFGSGRVDDDPRINHGRDGKGDAGGNIGFDKACYYIYGRTLGGNDEVDTGSSGHLSNPGDGVFDFDRGKEHDIGQFIDQNNHIWEGLKSGEFIIRFEISHPYLGEKFVTVVHFAHGPFESGEDFVRLDDDRGQKMRNTIVIS